MDPEAAVETIDGWAANWGQPHLDLACHAAFPLALTPDLLYHIWANFRRDVDGNPLEIPWEAVPDLLLSTLCRASGAARYRMEDAVRDQLLQRLVGDERFGAERLRELGDFVRVYVDRQRLTGTRYEQQHAENEALAALAYTAPETLVEVLADAYESGGLERAHLVRLSRLLQTFHGPVTSWVETTLEVQAEFERLREYGEGLMGRWARGDRQGAAAALRRLGDSGRSVRIAQRSLPLPEELVGEREARPAFTYRVSLHTPGDFAYTFDSPAGGGGGGGTLALNPEADPDLFRQLEAVASGRVEPATRDRLGPDLFQRLVPDQEQFQVFYADAQTAGADLRFLLEMDARQWPEAARTPWELMALPPALAGARAVFLAWSPQFSLVRVPARGSAAPIPRERSEPLRILLAGGYEAGQPLPYPRLFEAALARHGAQVALTVAEKVTPEDLARLVQAHNPHALHLVGEIDTVYQAPRLALWDAAGREAQWLDDSVLPAILDPWRGFLFLHPPSPAAPAAHLAGLLAAQLPAVAAAQLPLSWEAWQQLLFQLYQGLLHDLPAGAAFQAARRATGSGEQASPAAAAAVLYTRLLDTPLFPVVAAPEEEAAEEPAQESAQEPVEDAAEGPAVEAEEMGETAERPALAFDFSEWIGAHTRNFRNREEALQTVAEWVANPEAPPLLLITGEPGRGKTALAARLAQISAGEVEPPPTEPPLLPGFLSAVHFAGGKGEWQEPALVVRSLAAQLAQNVPEYESGLAGPARKGIRSTDVMSEIAQVTADRPAAEAFEGLIVESLWTRPPSRPVVFFIDALDELAPEQQSLFVELLARLIKGREEFDARLVLTIRSYSSLIEELAWMPQIRYELPPLEPPVAEGAESAERSLAGTYRGVYQYQLSVRSEEGAVRVDFRNPDNTSGGQPRGAFRYREYKEQIAGLHKQAADLALNGDQIKELGEALFNSLFNDELRTHFLDRFSQVQKEEGRLLRLEIEFDEEKVPHLAALPWELMRMPVNPSTGPFWLATVPRLVMARTRGMWMAADNLAVEPGERLRIGLVVAGATGPVEESERPADGERELGVVTYKPVEEALAELAAENAQIEILPTAIPATRHSIDTLLEQKPHILHFIGHGRLRDGYGWQTGEIALIGRDLAPATALWISAEQFGNLFSHHRPAVVVLQPGENARVSTSEAFSTVAGQLVGRSVPAAVAMQYAIGNSAVAEFAREFYRRLAEGLPVDVALQEGRFAISDWHETIDFAAPVLYMRSRHGQIFSPPSAEEDAGQESENMTEGASSLARARQVLLDCGPFGSNESVHAVFAIPQLRLWRHNVPAASSPAARVDSLIAYLTDRFRADTKENGLVLFLEALADRTETGDMCNVALTQVARALRRELQPPEWL